jgi:hypothetical protein
VAGRQAERAARIQAGDGDRLVRRAGDQTRAVRRGDGQDRALVQARVGDRHRGLHRAAVDRHGLRDVTRRRAGDGAVQVGQGRVTAAQPDVELVVRIGRGEDDVHAHPAWSFPPG